MTERALFAGRRFDAFLFDMDGTVLTSIASAERTWTRWAQSHGLDVATFLPTIHGVRTVETIARLGLPGVDPQAEADAIMRAEIEDVGDVEAIAGAAAFLASLPRDRWAIVTSAPRELAERRLQAAGLPPPPLMIAAEDVEHGKPAPDCFLLAAATLDLPAERCLVFEDTQAGVAAAEAASAAAFVITATHTRPFDTPHPTRAHYEGLSVRAVAAGGFGLMVSAESDDPSTTFE